MHIQTTAAWHWQDQFAPSLAMHMNDIDIGQQACFASWAWCRKKIAFREYKTDVWASKGEALEKGIEKYHIVRGKPVSICISANTYRRYISLFYEVCIED